MDKKKKRDDDEMILTPIKKTNQTASKKDIQNIFNKAVKTHGKTLERLSKN